MARLLPQRRPRPARALFARYSDLVLVAGVVAIVAMMILPLPAWLIDLLVAVNIAIGLVLLLLGDLHRVAARVLGVPERAADDHAVPAVAVDRDDAHDPARRPRRPHHRHLRQGGGRRQPGGRAGGVPDHHGGAVHRHRQGRRARGRGRRALLARRDAGQAAVDRLRPALGPDRQGRGQAPPPRRSSWKASCTAASTAR